MRVTFAPDQVSQCFVHRILANRMITAWKVSKYGVFSGPYFPAFGLNTGKYGPAKSPHLGTFHPFIFSTEVQSETSQKSDKTFWENSFDFQPLTIFAKRSIFDV